MAHDIPAPTPASATRPKWLSPTALILWAMIIGLVIGLLCPAGEWPKLAVAMQTTAQVFLRLIKSLIAPLIFATLVVGIAGHGDDLKKVGRLAFRSILYFEIVTTLALVVGLVAVNVIKPGAGVSLAGASAEQGAQFAGRTTTVADLIKHIVPDSVVNAAATNDVLPLVVFAVLFAIGVARTAPGPRKTIIEVCEAISQVMFKYTELVMLLAPLGVLAAIAYTVMNSGVGVIKSLGLVIVTLYAALLVFVLLVLLPVALIARIPVRDFWRRVVKEPWLIAFSTASSEAALPKAMENLDKYGIPRRITAFVLPTGYSFNLDGSTLYLSVAAVFAAQAGGIELSIGQQLLMMLTLMLTSKGVAGVPRAALVILSGALAMFGLPLEAVAILLGADAVMDMARTSVNVMGNCLAAGVMARWEGERVGDEG